MVAESDFRPEEWAAWMRAHWARIRVGGVWGAPDPGFILEKTERGWKVRTGQVDSRTRLVCKAAGLEIEE